MYIVWIPTDISLRLVYSAKGWILASLGLLVPVCLPILCRLWEQARRWDRCLCSPPSDWAGWQGVAYAALRQLYQETAGHGGEELIWGRETGSLARRDHWNLTPMKSIEWKEKPLMAKMLYAAYIEYTIQMLNKLGKSLVVSAWWFRWMLNVNACFQLSHY